MSARNTIIFKIQDIYDQCIKNFPNNAFETAELWCTVGLTAILRLLKRKSSFFLKSVILIVV